MIQLSKLFLAGILFICSTSAFAEDVDIVTLTTTAEGKTKDEAVINALRSAIEQAFGAFISSNTEIVNDELIRDEIVSVSNGNVQKFDVLSSTTISNGNTEVSAAFEAQELREWKQQVRIKAYREIAIEYAKNQSKTIIYNRLIW